ncbi:MAG: helix-turn-helix-type transcriptional regulator [Bacteroidetes bacterium]|nr:MAG: helix-turn-helix-type transcriptional regulator [Bacteroidota bacterium]
MANYSIKDLENFTGIKAHTLRMWEKRYNVVEPKRTCTNIRYYDDDDLKKLLNISILNKNGFKISFLVSLDKQEIKEKVIGLTQTNQFGGSIIENLIIAMLDFNKEKIEKLFNTSVVNIGFENTILNIMYPFFEKIKILWQTGSINLAHEHFVSNLIRQKTLVAIDALEQSHSDNQGNFLLFLPENEYYELSLLFYYYILKKNGHKVIYLGENVSLDCLDDVSKKKMIDHFLISLTSTTPKAKIKKKIEGIAEKFPETIIFISGLQTASITYEIPPNIILLNNISEFKNRLSEIMVN